jgi:hypothetical protein
MRVLTVLAGTLIISKIVYRLLVVVDEIENFPVGSRKMRQTFLNDGASILFCTSVSGSSAGSSIMSSTPSFNCSSERRLSDESALLRAMANNQVETCDLALKQPADFAGTRAPSSSSGRDQSTALRRDRVRAC